MSDFDDFGDDGDDFGDDGFMDGSPYDDDGETDEIFDAEDEFCELETDELVEPDFVVDLDKADTDNEGFTARDAFYLGAFAGNAYEEALEEARRKRLLGKRK